MKIVITDSNFPDDSLERSILNKIEADVNRFQCRNEQEVLEYIWDADGVLVQFAPITRRVIEGLQRCKIIVRYGIGVDNVDLTAAKDHGIIVCNVPTYCLDEVADHTVALILCLSRKIIPLFDSVKRGEWTVQSVARPLMRPVHSTVGLVGFGRIGDRVAKRLTSFNYNLVVYDPYLSDEKFEKSNIRKCRSLEELLRESDFVSLHVPLTDETRSIINARTLSHMKETAYIVNTSRGALIDTEALVKALDAHQIAGAALDVLEEEPLAPNHLLRSFPEVILTPHAAYYSETSMIELQKQAACEIVRYYTNQPLNSRVNT